MKTLLFLIPLLIGCSLPKNKSPYQKLSEYEGHYEYVGGSTLDLIASEFDTTLYAILDNAKYPLKYIEKDSFVDISNQTVVFERNKEANVISYKTNGETFKLIDKEFEKVEMFPRRSLFQNPNEYSYQPPQQKNDGLLTGVLKDEFTNPEPIINMVKKTIKGDFEDVHSILIYKNNKLVLEEYFYGYDENTPHQLRSASKPIIGGILGITIDKGFIKSEKEKLLPFFKEKYQNIQNMDERKKEITIENFLTYRHGMDCQNNNPESKGHELKMMESEDWVKYTLDLPIVQNPGKSSSYCTGCALTLGSLVEVTTNEKIEDFAKKYFYEPMEITNYKWTFEPNPTSSKTFSQMYITPRDLIKIAKMYKDNGKWNGKQILSKEWIDKSFEMEKGDYGYLWEHKYFIVDGKQYNSYLASGNGGQKINIWPELDMITVFTGGNYNSYKLYGKSTPPNEMIPNHILKAVQ
ncbi:serine hydrolase domain-containing protein [Bernardetia sp.]|uniref:serine hydrolase domain-containing protein n=1 Tax=Bernardetia sp. TaxID=1937974 RepID=UPI0025B9547F|nr:serine hydrolase domain-containing protein [Bernardetia sp.]